MQSAAQVPALSARRSRRGLFVAMAAGGLLAARMAPGAERPAVEGRVELSDGTCHAGRLSLAPGQSLRLHHGGSLRTFALDEVAELGFHPVREELERTWRFVEAGRTAKEFDGVPYPVRELSAALLFQDGTTLTGHLYTAALYVESPGRTLKVVLPAKQRGAPGETLDGLVYPVRVTCRASTPAPGVAVTIAADPPAPDAPAELAGLTLGDLARLEGVPAGAPHQFSVRLPPGRGAFLAVRGAGTIAVGWPESDADAARRVEAALPNVRDFFDTPRLLGAWSDPRGDTVYALMMLRRSGKTTLGGTASQPWRLGVWRWKQGADGRLLLAGRGFLFRGILPPGAEPPSVQLSRSLWKQGVGSEE